MRDGLARTVLNLHPKGQVVAITIAVVPNVPTICHKTPGVGAVTPCVPTNGRLLGDVLDDVESFSNVLSFCALWHGLVVDPAVAMTSDFMPFCHKGLSQFLVPLQSHAHPKNGQGQFSLIKFSQNAPNTCPGSVLINALHGHVSVGKTGRIEHFRQKLLRPLIAMQGRVFRALFVVQDKLHGYFCFSRPIGEGRMFTIALKISGVRQGGVEILHVGTAGEVKKELKP